MTNFEILKETKLQYHKLLKANSVHKVWQYVIDISEVCGAGDNINNWVGDAYLLGYDYIFFNTILWDVKVNTDKNKLEIYCVESRDDEGNRLIMDNNFDHLYNYIKFGKRQRKLERILGVKKE